MAQDGDETQSVVESLPDAPPVKQSYRSFKYASPVKSLNSFKADVYFFLSLAERSLQR